MYKTWNNIWLHWNWPTKRHSHQPETYWFVFDGGTGYTQVELAILLDAGIDQSLNRGLFLEEQEGVAWEE